MMFSFDKTNSAASLPSANPNSSSAYSVAEIEEGRLLITVLAVEPVTRITRISRTPVSCNCFAARTSVVPFEAPFSKESFPNKASIVDMSIATGSLIGPSTAVPSNKTLEVDSVIGSLRSDIPPSLNSTKCPGKFGYKFTVPAICSASFISCKKCEDDYIHQSLW